MNLKAIQTLKDRFGLPVGFSDHTKGYEAAIAAVALGAEVIEKHFTLDRSLPGPDQVVSLMPEEFTDMVSSVRNVERSLGDGLKTPTLAELENMKIVRKSLVLKKSQIRGTVLTEDLLTAKRPATGLSADCLESIIGKRLNQNVQRDVPLQPNFLE